MTAVTDPDELAFDFDVCIAGTGLPECLVAAGLSVRGYRVLQIDACGSYGGGWGSHSLLQQEQWVKQEGNEWTGFIDRTLDSHTHDHDAVAAEEQESLKTATMTTATHAVDSTAPRVEVMPLEQFYRDVLLANHTSSAHALPDASSYVPLHVDRRLWYLPFPSHSTEGTTRTDVISQLHQQSSRFNFDLSPKMMYAESSIISILVKSGVARYLDFRGIDTLTLLLPRSNVPHSQRMAIAELFPTPLSFELAPLSKGAIFKNVNLSLVEKRTLMNFITTSAQQALSQQAAPKPSSNEKVARVCLSPTPRRRFEGVPEQQSPLPPLPTSSSVAMITGRGPMIGMSSFLSPASMYHTEGRHRDGNDSSQGGEAIGGASKGSNEEEKDEGVDGSRKAVCEEKRTRAEDKEDRQLCLKGTSWEQRTWAEALACKKLSLPLRQRITYGMCLKNHQESNDCCDVDDFKQTHSASSSPAPSDWMEHDGMLRLWLVASSYGKYCDGSFIIPTFGIGDLTQAFARLSAVYRGVFMLRTSITHVEWEHQVKEEQKRTTPATKDLKKTDIADQADEKIGIQRAAADCTKDPPDSLPRQEEAEKEMNVSPSGFFLSAEQQQINCIPLEEPEMEPLSLTHESSAPQIQLLVPTTLTSEYVNGRKLVGLRLTGGQRITTKRLITSLDNIHPVPALDRERRPTKEKGTGKDGKFFGDATTAQSLSASFVPHGSQHREASGLPMPGSRRVSQIARLVAVTDQPLLPGRDDAQFSVAVLPSMHPIQIMQLNWNSGCCPIHHYLIYMSQIVQVPMTVHELPPCCHGRCNDSSMEDAPPQYATMLQLLQQLLQSKQIVTCLMVSTWTQNVRVPSSVQFLEQQVVLTPDPKLHEVSLILDELVVATEIVSNLLKDSIPPDSLIPMPPHVEAEKRQDSMREANQPFEKLDEMAR